MKLGIITIPPKYNYGGILQAYAMQEVLKKLGHEPMLIPSYTNRKVKLWRRVLRFGKLLYLRFVIGQSMDVRWSIEPPKEMVEMATQQTQRFIDQYIVCTEPVNRKNPNSILDKYEFEGFVVGSDQIWLSKYLPFAFLDFLPTHSNKKLICYAASNGRNSWTINPKTTKQCRTLAQNFNAISVRELGMVEVSKEVLGVQTTHVLDPTMLLSKDYYLKFCKPSSAKSTLFSYVLDKSAGKMTIEQTISNSLSLEVVSLMPELNFNVANRRDVDRTLFSSVEDWLSGISNADFVFTDSFHGTVFAIIFNKPFIVCGNKQRGMHRFESLLTQFGLMDRLVYMEGGSVDHILNTHIDYKEVCELLEQHREFSISFINNSLNSENKFEK